jgi:4-amino-4-deoxy-L-arabinose transferase-like glycosyltransferase
MNLQRYASGLTKVLEAALAVACCVYLAAYVMVALRRLNYPFDLEWMEGGSVDHVRRLLAGEKIYVPPSLAFIPYLYPPFYYYVSALVALVIGVGLLPLRLVSFACSLGCLGVLYRFVMKETGSKRAGLISAGMFAATYRIGGAWFDLARVDSLFLLLMLLALYLVRFGRSRWSWPIAGVLIALSALTKQTAMLMALPVVLYAVTADWKRGLALAGGCAAVLGGATLVLEAVHRGWYLYYVFGLPARIQTLGGQRAAFWQKDIFGPVPIAAAIAGGYLLSQIRRTHRPVMFYAMFAIALFGSAWVSRLHSGAYDNVLIPAYLFLSVMLGLAMNDIPDIVTPERAPFLRVVMAVLCLLQLSLLRYSPSAQVPGRRDVELQRRLLRLMSDADGEVYLAQHGFFPILAGKNANAQAWAVSDILRTGGTSERRLSGEIHEALLARRFRLIVLDRLDPWLEPELSQRYHRVGPVFDEDGLWTVTGYHTHPRWVYAPN